MIGAPFGANENARPGIARLDTEHLETCFSVRVLSLYYGLALSGLAINAHKITTNRRSLHSVGVRIEQI